MRRIRARQQCSLRSFARRVPRESGRRPYLRRERPKDSWPCRKTLLPFCAQARDDSRAFLSRQRSPP